MSDAELATPFRQRAGGAMKDAFLQEALTIVEPLYAEDPRNAENVELMMDLHSQLSAVEGMSGSKLITTMEPEAEP